MKKKDCLLWRIESDYPGDSWLFGTMHIQDAKAFGLLELLFQKIDACNAFAAELNLDEINNGGTGMLSIPPVPPLFDLLPSKHYQKLKKILKKALDINLDRLAHLHPMIVSKIISDTMMASEMPEFLDDRLWGYARSREKSLHGIETFEEQIHVFHQIPLTTHIDHLKQLSKNYSASRKKLMRLLDLYSRGDLRQLHKAALKGTKNKQVMVYQRNSIMVNRIDALIQENETLFAAVGAGHLWGEKGVIRGLKHRGYRLKPFA